MTFTLHKCTLLICKCILIVKERDDQVRTTLIIKDPVYRRAREYAGRHGMRLSRLATEAMEEFLLRRESAGKTKDREKVRLQPLAMGAPRVDVDNREELYRRMEEA